MKNITIKQTPELLRLAEILEKETDELIEEIMQAGHKSGYILDDTCIAGEYLHELLDDIGFTEVAPCFFILGIDDTKVVTLFNKLQIWGLGECPNCGCHSEPSENNDYYKPDIYSELQLVGPIEEMVCTTCNYEFSKIVL